MSGWFVRYGRTLTKPHCFVSFVFVRLKAYGQCTVAEVGCNHLLRPTRCNKARCTATNTSTTNETHILEQTYNSKTSIVLQNS